GRIIADQPQPDFFLLERLELAFEIETHQGRQIGDLLFASAPVFGREGVDRQDLDAVVRSRLERPSNGFGARAMPGGPREAALLRPTAIPVHDDRDVAGDGPSPTSARVEPFDAACGAAQDRLRRDMSL